MAEIINLNKKVKSISKWEDYTYQAIKSLENDHYCDVCKSIIRASKKDLISIRKQWFFLICPNCESLVKIFSVERNIEFY